jgi:hypothetical protein
MSGTEAAMKNKVLRRIGGSGDCRADEITRREMHVESEKRIVLRNSVLIFRRSARLFG